MPLCRPDFPSIMSGNKEIWEAIGAEAKRKHFNLLPLYNPGKHDEAVICGSSVLIAFGSRAFLWSAAHVFDECASTTLYFPGESYLEELEGDVLKSTAPAGDRNQDLKDVGIMEISPDSLNSDYQFIDGYSLNLSWPKTAKFYSFTGYPHNSNKPRYGSTLAKHNQLLHTSVLAPEKFYSKHQLDLHIHIALTFDPKKSLTNSGRIQEPPNVYGVSGGALWSVELGLGEKKAGFELVGITTEQKWAEKIVFGTHINLFMQAMRAFYPSLFN